MSVETREGPAPIDIERVEDEHYGHEFQAMVACFRIELESGSSSGVLKRLAELTRGRHPLSHEQSLLAFIEWYGLPALLRALARAIEHPAQVLGSLEGD
ncbi:hypothetical protein UFOVP1236_11 [uncultured Caudovirales phage]|uniref:Uncharacterized protein n=1 Tax=uncultured Caudovirales phage TaxID=2100421 RepID=A0A6J5R491_9CAUD|nr:hypothetical protein UFOVP1236_11 [uncultured Caudovirales phage]